LKRSYHCHLICACSETVDFLHDLLLYLMQLGVYTRWAELRSATMWRIRLRPLKAECESILLWGPRICRLLPDWSIIGQMNLVLEQVSLRLPKSDAEWTKIEDPRSVLSSWSLVFRSLSK
jgi:hypothetical protein